MIEHPFRGFGLACHSPLDRDGDLDEAVVEDEIQDVRTALVDWSRSFPEATFVYIQAECFGGSRLYGGCVCRNGIVLLEEQLGKNDDWAASEASLLRLLAFLDVRDAVFEPLSRGYFDPDRQR